MPVQPFGKADPYYDALRVMSNQNIQGAALGDTGTGGILENKIYLWPADGSTIMTFAPTQAGLIAALAAAVSGDTVWLPSITIVLTTGVTVPAGVTVLGIDYSAALSFSGFSGTGVTLNAGSVINNITILYDGTGQSSARGILASGTDWNVHLCNVYVHGASTNIGLQGAGTSTLFRGFVEFSHIHATIGSVAQAIITSAGGCVTISYTTALADAASTSQALNNAASSNANEVIIEHCRFDSDQDGIYNNAGYLLLLESSAAGTTNGINNTAAGVIRVYAVRWSSLLNAGTVTYLDGDRLSSGSPTLSLTNTHIFVGNALNVATDVAMSNDATIANTGALTLKNTGPGATGPLGSATVTPIVTIDAQGRVTGLTSTTITGVTPAAHQLTGALHTESGLTPGDVLTALTATTFGFTTLSTSIGAVNAYNEIQIADGISTIYYLANYAVPGAIRVYIDGIRQPASDDTAPTDIVSFGVAPDAGAVLLFDYEMDLT